MQYLNREIGWLRFNARVLDEASRNNPLLERLRFLTITSSNLDEFFMVRVAGMHRQIAAGVLKTTVDGLIPSEQLDFVSKEVHLAYAKQAEIYNKIIKELDEIGIELVNYQNLTKKWKIWCREYYRANIHPVLTPLAVDPSHPFPFVSNLSLNLAVMLENHQFARVKVPVGVLPRLIKLDDDRFILLEELIQAHIQELFSGWEVVESYTFRVTRDADLEIDQEGAEDLLESIEQSLRKRRFGGVVRLEVENSMPQTLRNELAEYLEVTERDLYPVATPLGLPDFSALCEIPLPARKAKKLLFPAFTPGVIRLDSFNQIKAGDILLHHPYQSFSTVIDFLRLAANDPNVLAIKQTLYRTGADRNIIDSLLKAVESGKQVVVIVEIRARFDEERNIGWARALERAGVHVVYGVPGLKTHAKITLVVRRENESLKRYVHISTGNYNPRTSKLYTDIGLLTANQDFGKDASNLFNALTGYSEAEYQQFILAPERMRAKIIELIEREANLAKNGHPAHLIAKMNALTDPDVINALYQASQDGLKIDLIIRGICCLRPKVPKLSENISVRSIIGRFLEHSRIFYFENGGNSEIYLSSADWMDSKLSQRVELMVPIFDENHAKYLREVVLGYALLDTTAWELLETGEYKRIQSEDYLSSQKILAELHGEF